MEVPGFTEIPSAMKLRWKRVRTNLGIWQLSRQVAAHSRLGSPARKDKNSFRKPVAFFNASTRITGMSLNAAYSLLAALGLQMAGVPVVYFTCNAGMSRCVLGTDREYPQAELPCQACKKQSRWLFANAPNIPFSYQPDHALDARLDKLGLEELARFAVPVPATRLLESESRDALDLLPLGVLVLPSIRWVLRRHNLEDDDPTRFLLRQTIQSAYSIARAFGEFLDQVDPAALVVFNGQFFPEATAAWLARRRGLRVITHEVGMRPFTAFFTEGEATAYPLHIPDSFELTSEQETLLDAYLERRFQGRFSMAGVTFWPEMQGLDEAFLQKAEGFRQLVPVFTNVIFDTSQPHSNVVFPDMFAWLDEVLEIMCSYPETLFVIRAHPDENRPGKESRESVRSWIIQHRVTELPNIVFYDSGDYISSYQLIQRSKFVMIYNSTIGLEASILGAAVLCAGKARFTQYPTVYFPATPQAYRQQAEQFLEAEQIEVPEEYQKNSRRFLYYQLYCASLPFDEYLQEDGVWPGFVRLRRFHWSKLAPENSATIRALLRGITGDGSFLLEA